MNLDDLKSLSRKYKEKEENLNNNKNNDLKIMKNLLLSKKLEIEENKRKVFLKLFLGSSIITSFSSEEEFIYFTIASSMISSIETIKYGLNVMNQYDAKLSLEKYKQLNQKFYEYIIKSDFLINYIKEEFNYIYELNKIKLTSSVVLTVLAYGLFNNNYIFYDESFLINSMLSGVCIDIIINYYIENDSIIKSKKYFKELN